MNTAIVHQIRLAGCAPVPLAFYLKALGILRLVAEQKDHSAKGLWQGDAFVLKSRLDEAALVDFLLNEYEPTPVIAPWNGGSGFYYQERKLKEKDPSTGKKIKTGIRDQPTAATRVVDALMISRSTRLKTYRGALHAAKRIVNEMELKQAPSDLQKHRLIEALRSNLPDCCVPWIDVAVVLLESGPSYPPLMGTGGNDGNTDFTSNFMQRLADLFDADSGLPTPSGEKWLRSALFGDPIHGLQQGTAIGQFLPAATGGDNSCAGFRSDSVMNPWDFVLMIEGGLVFAAASVKRLESTSAGNLSAPFCVRHAGVGYATASLADENNSRPEMWMPLWATPTSLDELKALIGEGRAQVAGRPVRNGVDFARAVVCLGVDRGISAFQRYGFQVRNGLAYFATPLDRPLVRRNQKVDLLNEIDAWLQSFRGKAISQNAPSSVASALRQLESAILSLCRQGNTLHVQGLLAELGQCESMMARRLKWTSDNFLRPVPPLSGSWLSAADDGSPEFRLAASLASVYGRYGNTALPLRCQLEPVRTWIEEGKLVVRWDDCAIANVAWHEGDVVRAMNAVMERRLVLATKEGLDSWPDTGRAVAGLGDITAFIEGRVDSKRFADLLWGFCLLDWPQVSYDATPANKSEDPTFPGVSFALMKLCHAGSSVREVAIPLTPTIHQQAVNGNGAAATQSAARRLLASGLAPALHQVHLLGPSIKRAAAALLFPLSHSDLNALADAVLRPKPLTT